ncbi:type I restriction-modification system DNA methylase subunit [Aurantimicrobium minutum]|nr:type I restriction-modification system DNA methylase subunit [Aurantimicrobium minutum]
MTKYFIIDARTIGTMVSRRLRQFSNEDILKIANTYHSWRNIDGKHLDIPGFVKSATIDEIRTNNFVLSPQRYVGVPDAEIDDEPIEDKISRLSSELFQELARGHQLEEKIRSQLSVGYQIHE